MKYECDDSYFLSFFVTVNIMIFKFMHVYSISLRIFFNIFPLEFKQFFTFSIKILYNCFVIFSDIQATFPD